MLSFWTLKGRYPIGVAGRDVSNASKNRVTGCLMVSKR